MKILIVVVSVLVALIGVVVGIGYSLPVKHRASRAARYSATPDVVFAIISNPVAFPEWRSRVKSVECVTRSDGKFSFRETGADGKILYVVEEATRAVRLVTRIDDKSLPFGGQWTFELAPSASGTTLVITEDGEVYNPLFRFMSKYIFGHHASIDTYLKDLGKKLGTSVTPQG